LYGFKARLEPGSAALVAISLAVIIAELEGAVEGVAKEFRKAPENTRLNFSELLDCRSAKGRTLSPFGKPTLETILLAVLQ
jgi:hypothetical protein